MILIIDMRNLNCINCGARTFCEPLSFAIKRAVKQHMYIKAIELISQKDQAIIKNNVFRIFFERFHRVFRGLDNLIIFFYFSLNFWRNYIFFCPLNTGAPWYFCFLRNVSVTAVIHDLKVFDRPDLIPKVRGWFRKLELKNLFYAANKLIFVSNFTKNSFKRNIGFLNRYEHTVIYEGVPEYCIESAPDLKLEVPEKGFLLTVGNNINKNISSTFSVFKYLKENYNYEGILIIVGSCSDQDRKLANSLNIFEDIIFLSNISNSELLCLYDKCDAFIFASIYEGFGLPVLEAASRGCRLVLNKCEAISEIAPDNAFLVDINDFVSAANMLNKALKITKPIRYDLSKFNFQENSDQLTKFVLT